MDTLLLKGAKVIDPSQGINETLDVLIEGDRILALGHFSPSQANAVMDLEGLVLTPGFIDIHSHLRDPGYEWKEDIESGSQAAVAGGITSVCCMANTYPVNDNPSVTRYIIDKASRVGLCDVFPVGALTKGLKGEEIAELGLLKEAGVVAFSDDGQTPQDSELFKNALLYAKWLKMPVFCHSEDRSLSEGGQINEGVISERLGLKGIPNEAEFIGVMRDLAVARLTGAKIHICHVSTAESLKAIAFAKRLGVKVTCEVTPHHFTLTDRAVEEFDTNAKVAPPLRSSKDREACRQALSDGTADVIATDHAPHTCDEKKRTFKEAPFGLIGFQTMLPLSLNLVREGYLTLEKLIEKITILPAKIIGKSNVIGSLKPGYFANITVFDPNEEFVFSKDVIVSKSRNSPFVGWKLKGKVKLTVYRGKIVFKDF